MIVLRASPSASDYEKHSLTIQIAKGQLPQRKKLPFVPESGERLQTKPAQNVTVSAVHPLDYVISELLASIISTE